MNKKKSIIISFCALILLFIVIILYARFIEPNLMVVNKNEFKTEINISPFRMVLFSDTHFGSLYDQKKIEDIVIKINEQKPDIVVFGGDFLDSYYRDKDILDLDYISSKLSLINANYAKIAVFGNHDYGGGAIRIYKDFMEKSGFKVLKNNSIDIDELNLTIRGLDDYLFGQPDLLLNSLQEDRFNVIVSHEPDVADIINLEKVNLILSGHSHGGQINIPFITNMILPEGAKKYVNGEYLFGNKRHTKLFVTKGLGVTKLPYRFLSVPEINVLDINME